MRNLFSFDPAPRLHLRRRLRDWVLPALLAVGGASTAQAQCTFAVSAFPAGPLTLCPGGSTTLTASAMAPGFDIGTGFDGPVGVLARQPDGKILVGGAFSAFNGDAGAPNALLRLNADGTLDKTFNYVAGSTSTGVGPSGTSVEAIVVQPDGKILIAGSNAGFGVYNGDAAAPNGVMRLNADGTLDTSFNYVAGSTSTGFNGNVYALARQPDGKIVVGGSFITHNNVNGTPNGLARLNADGSLDTSFNYTAGNNDTGVNGTVAALALQADGKIVVGGTFTAYNLNAAAPNNVLRVNADGSLDQTFNYVASSTSTGADAYVTSLLVRPGGQVVVGGALSIYNGDTGAPNYVLQLNADGTLDQTFNYVAGNVSTGANNVVATLALQPDGKVLAGGVFSLYNLLDGAPNNLLRINTDGTLDQTFNYVAGNGQNGLNGNVNSVLVQPDGKVLVAGSSTRHNQTTPIPVGVARLNANGSLSHAAAPVAGATFAWSNGATGASITVSQPGTYTATATSGSCSVASNAVVVGAAPAVTVSVTPAGPVNLPAGGSTTLTASATTARFAQTGTGLNARVYAHAVQADGKIVVGGNFSAYNGTPAANVARLNADGSLDASFTSRGTGSNRVSAIALQPDGKILIGGGFGTYGGVNRNSIARLNADGSLDPTFVPQGIRGVGLNDAVNAIVVQPDGKILVGGSFTRFDNEPTDRYIARFNADGSLDASFVPTDLSVNNRVFALALQPDGRILAGGDFTAADVTSFNTGGTPRTRIVRLLANGLLDPSFAASGQGFNSSVNAILVQPDGQVLVAGDFEQFASSTRGGIARLNADGTLDTGFVPAGTGLRGFSTGFGDGALGLALQADGKVLVAGEFRFYDNVARNYLARLNTDGSLDTGYVPASVLSNSAIASLTVLSSGKLLASGFQNAYGSTFVNYVMRLNEDASLDNVATPIAGATYAWSPGGATGASISVNASGSYTATATDPSTGCQYTSEPVVVTVATASDLVISTPGQSIPAGAYNNVTVTGTGTGTLQGNITVSGALLVQTGGQLASGCFTIGGTGSFTVADGAMLAICSPQGLSTAAGTGTVQTTGARSLSTQATYLYNGTLAQVTGNGLPATVRELALSNAAGLTLSQPLQVRRRVNLLAGNLALSGQALTLLSDTSGTALVVNAGGVVTGNTGTMQRHIERNTAANGYRHYSSPVTPETLATLATPGYAPNFSGAAAYNSSATPGAVTPFPTVFAYDQDRIATTPSNFSAFDKGWVAPTSAAAPMEVGRGYSVNAPGSVLVDFTGTFTTGPVTRSGLARTGAEGGWHLLGNPYPAPLDWSTLTRGAGQNLENMDGAVYVFQSSGPYSGSYRTYLAGAPGGGSPLIPAGSGFFVHTTTPGTPGTVRLTNANRVTTFGAQPAFGRPAADARPQLQLTLTSASGATDAATLYADPSATAGLDAAYDAVKLPNPSGLNLSTLAATGEALAIDGRPAFVATTAVPVQVQVPAAGTYTLRATDLLNLVPGTRVLLHDAQTGQETELRPQVSYPFTLSTTSAGTRFTLLFRPGNVTATAAAQLAAQVQVYPNPAHGRFQVQLPAGVSELALYNALGQRVSTQAVRGPQADVDVTGLATGVYTLRVQAGSTAISKRVVLN
ncbi:T9SS type A sorting domain-containing protein [Hymenobacter sp. B81]|uniref:T9SS type A sorting domain-containing protein n=1 Tax=Hymenobacter sp. B81 TaxID=3344878 RepID=UPI0037DD44A2